MSSDDDSYDDEYSEDFASQYGGQSQFGLSSIHEHDESEQSSSSQQLNKFSSSSQRSSHYSFDDGESKEEEEEEEEEEEDSYSMDDDFTVSTSISKRSIGGSISRHNASGATHLTSSSSKLENCNEEENVDEQSQQQREEEEEESKEDDSYSIDEDFTSVCSTTKQSVKSSSHYPSIPETCTDSKEDDDVDIGESSVIEKEVEDNTTNDHVEEYSMDEDFAVTSALSLKNECSSTPSSSSNSTTYTSSKEKCVVDGTKEDEVSISRSMQQQQEVEKGDVKNHPNDMDVESTTNSVDEEMVTEDKSTSEYASSTQDDVEMDQDHTSQKDDNDDTNMDKCLETREGSLASDTPTQNEREQEVEGQPTDIESAIKDTEEVCLEIEDQEEIPTPDLAPTQQDIRNESMDVDLADTNEQLSSSPKPESIDDCDQVEESIPKEDEVTNNKSSLPEPAKYVDELSYILDHESDEEEEYVEVASNIAVCCNQDDESMEPPVEIKTDKAANKRVDKCNPQMSIDSNSSEEKPLPRRQDKRKPRRSDAQTQTIPKAKKSHHDIQQSKPKPRIKKPSDFVPRCAYAQTKAMKLKKAEELKAAQVEREKSTKKVLRYSKKRLERLAQPAKHHVYDNKENIQPKSDNTCNKTKKKKSVDDESDYGPNFLERMETMEQERRESMARATAEALYQARTDKKKCPKCGTCQTYEEMIHDKTECQNDKCRRGKEKQTYQSPSKFEIKSFEERQRRSQQRRSLVVERIEEERRASLVGGRKSLHQQELLDKVEKARGDFHSRMAKDIAARKDKLMNAEKTARTRLEELHSFKPKLHVAEHLIRNRKGGWENLAAPSRRYTEEYQPPPEEDIFRMSKKKRRRKPLESPWGNSSSRSKKKVNDNTLRRRFQQTNM